MELGNFEDLIAHQIQVLQTAQRRKGQQPTQRSSRRALQTMFNGEAQILARHHIRQCFINFSYPPSTTPIASLEPTRIIDLRLETRHLGKVLLVRTFGHPRRIMSIQNAVEDTTGAVERLAIYNEDERLLPEQVLPKDAVFAIKEPFYKIAADGSPSLRIDHPSDLVKLHVTHRLFPKGFLPNVDELDMSGLDLKNAGNAAFARKDNLLAHQLYTRGIQRSGLNPALLSDLLRNRSIAGLHLGYFEAAEADAHASMVETEGNRDPRARTLTSKALYRAGLAAYKLRKFEQADNAFLHALDLTPADEGLLHQHERCVQRLREATHGAYDMELLSKSATEKHQRLDHADFTSKTSVRNAGKRGRGLFATEDIQEGDLILCEKAFNSASRSDSISMVLNLNTGRGNMGPHASLLFSTVEKLRSNPDLAAQFLDLYDGGYTPKCLPVHIDNTIVVDTFQVQAIIEYNCFGCPDIRSSDVITKAQNSPPEVLQSVGIWITASYVNHACSGNACRSFIGDIMMIRATRNIQRGEEITMPYQRVEIDHEASRKRLKQAWGFQCDCPLCVAESKTQCRQRQRLLRTLATFLSNHELSQQYQLRQSTIREAEDLYKDLDKAYDEEAFKNVPRIGLVDLGSWLCQAYMGLSHPSKALEAAHNVLRHSGYRVEVRDGLIVRHTSGHISIHMVDAAVNAAHVHSLQGRANVGKQYEDFAKRLYCTLFGELRGFDERYGD